MKLRNFIIHMLLVAAIVILLAFYFQRSLILVIQHDGFVLNILFILIPMMTRFGIKKSLSYFALPFKDDSEERDRKEAIVFFKSMTLFLILCSLIVSISVFCYYLGWLDDTLGRFLGTILTTPLYACLISVTVFIPMKDSLEKSMIK